MAEPGVVQTQVMQPVGDTVDELLVDVRPLRALFEELALEARTALRDQGITEPLLKAALDLCYKGQTAVITVPFPLEIEDAAICLADPLPLDVQALRETVLAFHVVHAERYGDTLRDRPVQVVMLRIYGQDPGALSGNDSR